MLTSNPCSLKMADADLLLSAGYYLLDELFRGKGYGNPTQASGQPAGNKHVVNSGKARLNWFCKSICSQIDV